VTTTDPRPAPPPQVWLGASCVLRRPVGVDEPYPHLCGHTVPGLATGRTVYLTRRECAAAGPHVDEDGW